MNTMDLKIQNKLDKEIVSFFRKSHTDKQISFPTENLTYSSFLSNKLLMIYLIKQGVPYSLFDLIQHLSPFSEKDWANFLDISTKSLHRYKLLSKHFRSLQSEKIIEMSEVTYIGLDVFGDMDKLKLWLETPCFALGNLKPIELLNDSYGKEMVVGELTRINYGIFA